MKKCIYAVILVGALVSCSEETPSVRKTPCAVLEDLSSKAKIALANQILSANAKKKAEERRLDRLERTGSEAYTLPDRLVIDGGDGDQSFFGSAQILAPVSRPWFTGSVGNWSGDALLFEVVEGTYKGHLVAVSPRTLSPAFDSLRDGGWASVIIHVFAPDGEDIKSREGIGMAVIEEMNRGR